MARQKFKPFTFDPISELEIEVPRNARRDAREAVASYLQEELLNYIGDARSPVSGGVWKRNLTPDYAKEKAHESGAKFANLELSGEMLDSLSVEVRGSKVVIDLGKDQYGKAEGHITGQYGDGKMKKDYRRQFIPQGDESLKRSITANIKRILREFEDG
jgi:hypothetical protein